LSPWHIGGDHDTREVQTVDSRVMFIVQRVTLGPISSAIQFFEFHLLQEAEKLNDDSDLEAFSTALCMCLNKGRDRARDLLQMMGRHFLIERAMVVARSVLSKWVINMHAGDDSLDDDKRWSQDLYLLRFWICDNHFIDSHFSKYLFVTILTEKKSC
jgi:hypothetical protein